MNGETLARQVLVLVPMILSLGVHEWAHAFAAYQLGDDTAEAQGRMTLNPLAHIDPVGTLLLPLLGVPFGWAKPVPVNPVRFRPEVSMTTGMLITAAAGPFSNMVLAALCGGAMALLSRLSPLALLRHPELAFALTAGLRINVGLALFNLLPVPPLDGSRIVDGFIPFEWRDRWAKISTYGFVIVLALMLLPILVSGINLASWVTTRALGL